MPVKIVAVGDLHGKFPKISHKDFDYILSVGDFSPSLSRDLIFEHIRKRMEDPDYDGEWWDPIGEKEADRRSKAEMERGREILEKLASYGKPVITIPGNTDATERWGPENHFSKFMIKGLKKVEDAHMRLIETPSFSVIGYGETSHPELPADNENKLYTKKELKEINRDFEKLERKYDRLFKKALKLKKPIILLGHNVPYDTKLDLIKNKKSPRFGEHLGSNLIRNLIEKYQPLLCLGGHMHDSKGACYINDTLCINLGEGSKANIYFEIHGSELKKMKK